MQYIVKFDDKTYQMRTGMTVAESAVILAATGITYGGFEAVLNDPAHEKFVLGLQAMMWLMKSRNGEACDLLGLNFEIDDFMEALTEGIGAAIAGSASDPAKKTVKRPTKETAPNPG